MAAWFSLETLLNPVSVEVFCRDYCQRRLLRIPGDHAKFCSLLTWQALNDILSHHDLSSRMTLAKATSVIPPDRFIVHSRDGRYSRLMAATIEAELRDGATLIINHIEDLYDPLTKLAAGLESSLGLRVWINMYASWTTTPAFDVHWDEHDAFILQIAGSKHWKLYGKVAGSPLKYDHKVELAKRPAGTPVWSDYLNAGDLLYIPRGIWHEVSPCDQPTLHLTIGFRHPTGIDLVYAMADRLRRNEYLRVDAPRFSNSHEKQCYLTELRRLVKEAMEGDLLEGLDRDRNASGVPRPSFGLPWSAGRDILPPSDDFLIRSLVPKDQVAYENEEEKGVSILFAGHRFVFPAVTRDLLDYLLSRDATRLAELREAVAPTHSVEYIRAIIKDLVRSGIAQISEVEVARNDNS